jgi:hypothetical protein
MSPAAADRESSAGVTAVAVLVRSLSIEFLLTSI